MYSVIRAFAVIGDIVVSTNVHHDPDKWVITIIGLVFLLLGIGTATINPFFACCFLPLGLFMFLGGVLSLEKEYQEEMNNSQNPDIKEGSEPWGIAAKVVLTLLACTILFYFWFLGIFSY